MKTVLLGTAFGLMLGGSGCIWPAATHIHGAATVKHSGLPLASPLQDQHTEAPTRMIVVKYWRVQPLFGSGRKFTFFGAEGVERESFSVSFPLRFYPVICTPALGIQHALPDAGLIVFAEGHWPGHVVADDGRLCCEAPTTGKRHWHVDLQPMGQPPTSLAPADGWRTEEFPPLTPDKLESVLRWSGSVTKAERQMCRRQLEQLVEYWRENPPPTSR